MEELINYESEYAQFMQAYVSGQTSGEETGKLIARLAQAYAQWNIRVGITTKSFNKVYAQLVNSVESNGKPVSVSKAEVMASITPEFEVMDDAQRNLKNVDTYINSLKSLQKGILNEYSHMGNS